MLEFVLENSFSLFCIFMSFVFLVLSIKLKKEISKDVEVNSQLQDHEVKKQG